MELMTFLTGHVVRLGKFIGAQFDTSLAMDLAEELYKVAFFLKVQEIDIMFADLKRKKYYARTAAEILEHIEKWVNERLNISANITIEEIKDKEEELNNIKKIYEDLTAGKLSIRDIATGRSSKERSVEKEKRLHKEAKLKYAKENKTNSTGETSEATKGN